MAFGKKVKIHIPIKLHHGVDGKEAEHNELQGIAVPNSTGLLHGRQNLDEQAPPAQG